MNSSNTSHRKRRPLALTIAIALAASFASLASAPLTSFATPPTPANSTTPAMIPVVGHDAVGGADPLGEVLVIVRDLANHPVAGAVVVLDFSGCADLRLCVDPHDPNAQVNCANRTVTKVAGANGDVRFRVVGWSVRVPGQPGDAWNCARIYANGELLASPSVSTYDLVGGNGLGPADLSAWLEDLFGFGGSGPAGGDYDLSYDLGPSDLSLLLTAFFADGSLLNCSGGGGCGP